MINENSIEISNIEIIKDAVEIDLSKVHIEVQGGEPIYEKLEVNANGTYTPTGETDAFNEVVVKVPERVPVLENKEITENGTYTPAVGFDGFGEIMVDVHDETANPYLEYSKLILAEYTEKYVLTDDNWVFDDSITEHNIRDGAFYRYDKLKGIQLNKIKKLGNHAFGYSDNIVYVRSESVTSVGEYTFNNNSDLTEVYLPNCDTLGSYAFQSCTSLKEIELPKVKILNTYTFYGCMALRKIYVPCVTSINSNYVFSTCRSLNALILEYNGVVKLANVNAFNNTPIKTSTDTGFIYVPDDLVESYKTATNWVTYASKIKPISELEG